MKLFFLFFFFSFSRISGNIFIFFYVGFFFKYNEVFGKNETNLLKMLCIQRGKWKMVLIKKKLNPCLPGFLYAFSCSCSFLFPLRKWDFVVVFALLLLCSYLLEFIYASLIKTKENLVFFFTFLLVHIVWCVSFWIGEEVGFRKEEELKKKSSKKIVYFHAYNFLFSLTIQGWLFGCEVVEHYCVSKVESFLLNLNLVLFFLHCQWFHLRLLLFFFYKKHPTAKKNGKNKLYFLAT